MSNSPLRTVRIMLLALIASAFSSLALTGCNTTAGVGKDVEAAGDAIEDKAEENKGY
jgi:predicted small secreted protein